jgi:hypothetical protein
MRRFVVLALCVIGVLLTSPEAHADPAHDTAKMREDLEAYFAGERRAALYAGTVGLLSVGGGIGFVLRGNKLVRGAGWSLIGLGALQAIGGGGYAIVLSHTVPEHEAQLARDPVAFKRDELTRMHGVVSRFTPIRWQDLAVAVLGAGIATYGFGSRRSTWKGVGLSISLQALAALALEEIDYHRALGYQEQLVHFQPNGGNER